MTLGEQIKSSDPAPEVDLYRILYQEAFEFAPDCQLVTDSHGIIMAANHAAAGFLSHPKGFLVGKPLGLFVASGYRTRFYECLTRLGREFASDQFETRLDRRGLGSRDAIVLASAADPTAFSRGVSAVRWMIRDVTVLKQAESDRSDLLARLVTVQEDERRRIARELHDTVAQLLTALTLTIKAAQDAAQLPPAVDTRLSEAQRLADTLGQAVHDLTVQLRPTVLDDLGLHAALWQHLDEWSARTGIQVDYQQKGIEDSRLPPDVETAVYRVTQEALTNVARHAGAQRISVVVSRYDGNVTLIVEDDGIGFEPEVADHSGSRLGLIGMRERAALCGGMFEVESSPGHGTTIIARFPVTDMKRVSHE